jgi:hypothetical protein
MEKEIKVLTTKQYHRLAALEQSARKYAHSFKGPWSESQALQTYHSLWKQIAWELGVLDSFEQQVAFRVKDREDFSQGYSFRDALT